MNPSVTPKRQPPWRPSNEHVEAVKNEVIKLKRAGAIKEVFYPLMVGEYRGGQEEDRKMVCVCGLYRSQQGLSKGSIPYA